MRTWKSRLAGLLSGLMLVSLLPTAALAAEPSADADVPAIAEIGMRIGDDYVKAEPQQPQIALLSMMPLDVERYDLDLTGYLPEELKSVGISTVLENLEGSYTPTTNPEDVAVWAKWSYNNEEGEYVSENDDYIVVDESLALDLSSYSRYSRYIYLELIVGTADQLNLSNTRYIVDVEISGYNDLLTVTAVNADEAPIDVYDTYLYSSSRYGNIYQIGVDKNDWTSGEQASLTLALSTEFSGLTATVYEGYYESLADIPADAVDITSQIMGTGYLNDYSYQSGYEGMPQITLALYRDGDLITVMPLIPYMYEDGLSLSYYGDLYADQEGSSGRNNVGYIYSNYYQENGYPFYTVTLKSGYPVDGTYYCSLSMYNPADATTENNGIAYVDKAVVGYYATSDAIPESAADVKEQLFSEAYSTGGYGADFSDGITFTVVDINGELHWVDIQTVENQMEEDLPSAPMPDSLDTYFRMETAMSPDEGTEILRYVMPYDADSYYYNGYQTVLLLNKDSSNNVYAVGSDTITPVFYTGNQVEMFAGHSGSSGVKQNSGETAVEFVSGEVILYSAAAENGTDLKNYWVTFLTQQSGPKLFVNATNDESHYVTVDGESIPQREVFLTDEYNNHHDVFFANIGDQDITGLYVRLENAQNVALDPYWTIGETTTLSAFTTTEPANPYGELANVAKIRLVPATDESGNILAGAVSGTLVIGYTGGGTEPVEEVRISLTGVAGAPKITTESVVDGVQYVPYSSLIQTNNMYESDAVTFELSGGELPEGVIVKPNGEVYGVPKENGSFTFEVTAVYNNDPTLSDTKEFTLEILDNSNQNVRNATDVGYDFVEDFPYEMEVYTDQIFYSQGPLDQFVDFWLDGEKLERDTDYTAEDGSTKITIQAQTFRNAGSGTHTLAAEFRTGGASDLNSTLKRTATNYTSTVAPSASGGGDDGSSSTYPISVTQPNNGTISVSRKNASQGERVTVTARPDTGYQLEKLVVTNSSTGASIAVTEQNGEYSFVMPSNRVIVQASFTPLEPQDDRMPFVDVRRSDWFSDAVAFVYENGLMVGTSETVFEPYTTTSRGMIVTILYQLAGKPESDGSYFADVPLNQYYAKAASWAAEQGVVAGYGDGKFGPDDPITREQIVMILMRYVQYCQIDTAVRGDLTQFADSGSIDPSALEAMAWAYAEDLMVGKGGGILDPKGPATRAEVATILTRLYEIISETNAT